MSMWIRFFAVSEKGRRTSLGDRWTKKHKAFTPADPDDEEYEVSVDLDELPKGTRKIVIDFTP